MIEQLREMIEMQKALDSHIFEQRGIKEYPARNMQLALFVELGELLNEYPTYFKHWKKAPVNNREKGLEEFVDCLHFQMSLFYHYENIIMEEWHDYNSINARFLIENPDYLLLSIMDCVDESSNQDGLKVLFEIGNLFGFTWDEIYKAYMDKNKVNYERIKNNY